MTLPSCYRSGGACDSGQCACARKRRIPAPTRDEMRMLLNDAWTNVDGLVDAYSHMKDQMPEGLLDWRTRIEQLQRLYRKR